MSFNHIVIQNILRDKWTYISYFLSSVFSILIFFLFLLTALHPMMSRINPDSTLGLTIILCSFIVYIFSFVFIVYSMLAFLKKKTKTLGIFMISGASMKQIQKMVFRENMLIAIAAIITAILSGLILSPLFLMIVKNVLQADDFGMYFPVQAIVATLVLFNLLFFIISRFTTRFIKKEEAVQLLKADVTQEKEITPAPFKLLFATTVSIVLFLCMKLNQIFVEDLGLFYYLFLFMSLLLTIYFVLTQGMLFLIRRLQNRASYYRKTNLLFVSDLKAKGKTFSHIIYLLTILLVAVFVGTSVLYSSYYSVEENTEAVYPYSFQYVSLPQNPAEQVREDIQQIESTFKQENEQYVSYHSAFKTDQKRRIGFLSNTLYNALGAHKQIMLDNDEYFVVAGNEGTSPDPQLINDYIKEDLQYTDSQQQMLLSTSLQNVYYVVPDGIYEALDYPENQVFAYELANWTEKSEVIQKIEDKITTTPEQRLVSSKVSLYETEKYVKNITFFIGFLLSLIFLSAAMSILYFYLQTSLAEERDKYKGLRKIGLAVSEVRTIVTKELTLLIFAPFAFATVLLFTALITLRNTISVSFLQMTGIGVTIFCLLFILSFFIIRKVYINKLLH